MSLGRRGRLRLGLRLRLGPRLRLESDSDSESFNFLSFISIDLPNVFHSTPLLSRVVCISLLSTTTTARFESTFSSRSAKNVFYAVSFIYERTNERTNKILRRRKKKSKKKKKSFVLSIVFVLRAHTRTRPRTNTTPRPRVSRRRRRRRRRRHGRGRATIKFVVDAFFDACAFQSPRVDDTRGGGETQNVFSF